MLIDADGLHRVGLAGLVDECPLSFGQHLGVGGVPRHPQALSDPGDAQVLTHDPSQRPPQATAGMLGPRLGGLAGVLAPDMTAADEAVAADRDQQCRGSPQNGSCARRRVNVSLRDALTPATAAPLVWLADLASRDRAIGVEELPDGFEAERLQTAEASDMSRSSR